MKQIHKASIATVSLGDGKWSTDQQSVSPRSLTPAKWTLLFIVSLGFLTMFVVVVLLVPVSTFVLGFFTLSAVFCLILLVVATLQWALDPTPGTLRYVNETGHTHFTQKPLLRPVTAWGMALFTVAVAVYSLYFVVTGLIHNDGNVFLAVPRSAWPMSAIFSVLAWLALRAALRAHREMQGASLLPERIEFTSDHRLVQLRWSHVAGVHAGTMRKAAGRKDRTVPCVTIEAADGRVFNIEAFELGSDPNAVAAFIRYHRDHPQAREWLVDPEDAIQRFQDAHTQSR